MLKVNEVESYAYGTYGNPVELLVTQDILSSGPLYTGKEFDSRTRTYYFGARFFDADLGVWLTPDPAGQFFNPYGFGGDGVNYVDPFGLWSIGFGPSIGWDKERGWQFGFGFGADFSEEAGISAYAGHNWHEDGTQTSAINGNAQLGAVNLGGGYSYNTESGHNVNTIVGVGGLNNRTNNYWATNGDYLGGTASLGYGWVGLGGNAEVGYEHGWGNFKSGGYAQAGYLGANARYHTANGWSYGANIDVARYEIRNGGGYISAIHGAFEFHLQELAADGNFIHYSDKSLLAFASVVGNGGAEEFVFVGHGNSDEIVMVDLRSGMAVKRLSPEQFAGMLKGGAINYNGEKSIKLYSCQTGSGGSKGFASLLKQNMGEGVSVVAPTTDVRYISWKNNLTGTNGALPFSWLEGDGKWVTY
jgi:RHS repeat-associated protein